VTTLIAPHGGELIDRLVPADEAETFARDAERLPAIVLGSRGLADLEMIGTGAASPLTGFMGAQDYAGVVENMRLADGTVWPLPFVLPVDDAVREKVSVGARLALHDDAGRLWGTLDVSDFFERDPEHEARHVYGTVDKAHPGVANLFSEPRTLAGGSVRVLLPRDLPFASFRLTPRAMREAIRQRGWKRVAGFQTRNPIHRAHEHLTKLALEFADGLVIHPLVGETKGDDVPARVRFAVYEELLSRYYPRDRTLLAVYPAAMRYAGPREALFHGITRKNYGITHFIVGRDAAGVGKFYGPFDAQQLYDRFTPEELGVAPLKFDATFYCKLCEGLASPRTCPHDPSARLELSGTKTREILRSGGDLPREFTRPEVARILREHYASEAGGAGGAAPAAAAPRHARGGFVLWFTGLSGAGKSSLAARIAPVLRARMPVEVLDGDEVRTHLSKGLGFSKEDRDTNIRRIGFVARTLARNGVAVITAAISPYAEVRDEVRRLVEGEGVPFVEVYAQAAIEALAERDPKGLYRKAMRGELPHFTGVSDPYEPPVRPEVVVRTDQEPIERSAEAILAHLRERRLLPD
jgi:sulfate adenylyltransferase